MLDVIICRVCHDEITSQDETKWISLGEGQDQEQIHAKHDEKDIDWASLILDDDVEVNE